MDRRPCPGCAAKRRAVAAAVCAGLAACLALAGCPGAERDRFPARASRTVIRRIEAEAARSAATAAANQAAAPAAPPKPAADGEARLALIDALRWALANNHDIQIAGYGPPLADEDVIHAEALFDPAVFLSNNFNRTKRPIQTTIDTGRTADEHLIENRWSAQYGIRKRALSGGTVSLYQDMGYLLSNSRYTIPDPQYTANLTTELKQPLLKGFGDPVNRGAIRVASLSTDVSFQDFRAKVMEAVTETVTTYWQLAFDLESVRVTRSTLDMAREVLRRETERLADGLSTALSVDRAQAAVSTREAGLVRAEVRARNTMDHLKLLLNADEFPLDGNVRVVPGEEPQFYVFEVDRPAAVAKALIHRPDLETARTAIAINQVRLDVADRERLPKLDATLRYTLNGLGHESGDSVEMLDPGGPFGWVAGIEFELPLGNRSTESDRRKRLIEYQRSLLEADRQITRAIQDVNQAVRTILSARDEVEATLRARIAADRTVKGEFVRFELGQVTNEELLRSQEVLGAAESDHLLALLNFNIALVNLAKAQGTLLEDHGIEVVRPPGPPSVAEPVRVQFRAPARPARPK